MCKSRTEEGRVLHWEKYSNYNQLLMDIFSTQILVAIKKTRTQKWRPDSGKIFKRLLKDQL